MTYKLLQRFVADRKACFRCLSVVLCLVVILSGVGLGYVFLFAERQGASLQWYVAMRRADRVREWAMREEEVALGPTTNMGGTLGSPHAVSGEFPEGLGLSAEEIPPFGKAVFPVDRVPNWGVMRTPAEWDRSYGELRDSDFVPVPAYDLEKLAIPLRTLLRPLTRESISIITAKLFYSTRYFGSYDLDAREFTGTHAGVDLKLAFGTPIGAIGGGRVILVDPEGPFGLHVIIEHEVDGGDTYYSVYGHLSSVTVKAGSAVTAGQVIGEVGMAGNTTAPHLHLQVDRYDGTLTHSAPYVPRLPPTPAEANRWSVNPITFIQQHAN